MDRLAVASQRLIYGLTHATPHTHAGVPQGQPETSSGEDVNLIAGALYTVKAEPFPMTDELGEGTGFQREMSLGAMRVGSSLNDDRDLEDANLEQPGTGALVSCRHRRRTLYFSDASGSLPLGRLEALVKTLVVVSG